MAENEFKNAPEKANNHNQAADEEYNDEDEDELDPETEQRFPMMPSGRSRHDSSGVVNTGEHNRIKMDDKPDAREQGSPVGIMAWVGFGLSVFALAALSISFCSPYWLQTYPNSFNTFQNLGLWEICMDNYMHHKDDSQTIYNGCWWVFSPDEQYKKLREWLLPPWMISVQVMVIGSLITEVSATLIVAFSFWHLCPSQNHEYHQTYSMFAASALQFLSTLTIFVAALVFGELSQDRQWMPRPDQNLLSWGFGFIIISAIATAAAGATLYYEANEAYKKLMAFEEDYNRQLLDGLNQSRMTGYAASEVSGYAPSQQSRYSGSNYGGTEPYSEKSGYQDYPEKQGYNDYPEKAPYRDYPEQDPQPGYRPQYSQGSAGYNDPGYYPQKS